VVPSIVFEAFAEPMASVPPDKFVPIVIAEVSIVAFIVVIFNVEAFIVDVLLVCTFPNELVITFLTQAVLGTLEELSLTDKEAFIIGLFEKIVVPSNVLVALSEPSDSVPLVKLLPILNTAVELFDCIVVVYKVPVAIYAVPAYRLFKLVVVPKALANRVFTQAVVGTLEELSVTDKDALIFGLFVKVVVPSIVFEAFAEPISSVPLVKLSQMLNTAVELLAFILLR